MRPDTARLRSRSLAGLWVAGIGFFVTRFTVSLAAYERPMSFFISGTVPLVFGLSLAASGIVMPVWLDLVGIPAAVPSITGTALATHLLAGATLAVVYHAVAARATASAVVTGRGGRWGVD